MPTYRELFEQIQKEVEQSQQVYGQGPWEQFSAKIDAVLQGVAELPGKALMGSDFETIKEKSPQGGKWITKVPQTTGEKVGAFAGEVVPEMLGEAAFLAGTGGAGAVPMAVRAVGSGLVGGIGGGVSSGATGAATGFALGLGLPPVLDKLIGRIGRKGIQKVAKLPEEDLVDVVKKTQSTTWDFVQQTGRQPTEDEATDILLKEVGERMKLKPEPSDLDPLTGELNPTPAMRQLINAMSGKVPGELPPTMKYVRFSTLYDSAASGNTSAFRGAAAMLGADAAQIDTAVKAITASKRDVKGRIVKNVTAPLRGKGFQQWLDELRGGPPATDVPNVDVTISGIDAALRSPEVSKAVQNFVEEGMTKGSPGSLEKVAQRTSARHPFIKFKGAGQQGHMPVLMTEADKYVADAFREAGIPPKIRKAMTGLEPPIKGLPVLSPMQRAGIGFMFKQDKELAVRKMKNWLDGVEDYLPGEEGIKKSLAGLVKRKKRVPIPEEQVKKAIDNTVSDISSEGKTGYNLQGGMFPLPEGARDAVEAWVKLKPKLQKNILPTWYNGLLLNTPTLLRNFLPGNALELATGTLERATRQLVEGGGMGGLKAQFRGIGFYEALHNAGEGWRRGMIKALRDIADKGGTVDDAAVQASEVIPIPSKMHLASKINSWMDDFFTTISYNMNLNDRLYTEAVKRAKKLGGSIEGNFAYLRKNIPDEISKTALHQSRRTTFRDVSEGEILQGLDSGFRWLHEKAPIGGRLIAPFGPTLSRIGKRGMEWSPIGLINGVVKRMREAHGLATVGEDSTLAIIRGVYGSAAMAGFGGYAMAGNLTGSLDHLSEGEKTTLRSAGKIAPYSMKIGDTWYSYRNLGPITMLLGTAANVAEYYKKEGDLGAAIASIPFEHMSQAINASYLPGVMEVFQAFQDSERYGKGAIEQMLRFLQPITLGAGIARAIDPSYRDKEFDPFAEFPKGLGRGTKRVIAERTPFLKHKSGRPKLGLWGEEIKATASQEATTGERLELLVSPFTRKKLTNDPIMLEVARLNAGLTAPSLKVDWLDGDEQYTASKAMGMLQKKFAADTINMRGYAELPDNEKRALVEKAHDDARGVIRDMAEALKYEGKEITYRALLKGLIAE